MTGQQARRFLGQDLRLLADAGIRHLGQVQPLLPAALPDHVQRRGVVYLPGLDLHVDVVGLPYRAQLRERAGQEVPLADHGVGPGVGHHVGHRGGLRIRVDPDQLHLVPGGAQQNVPKSVLDQLDYSREWLFTNSHGGPIRLYSWRANVWVNSLAKARRKDPKNPDRVVLEKHPRIHDLRHTCASWLLSAGVPLIIVSAHLGHEDTSVTAKIYGHLDRTAGQAAAAAMAKMLD